MQTVMIGARWDQESQNDRLSRARSSGLIEFVEANYPNYDDEEPCVADTPVFVHSPINAIASAIGLNRRYCEVIRDAGTRWDSPWIGEHLCALGPEPEGRLGYIVNPLLVEELVTVAARKVRRLQEFYGRQVALELGPHYDTVGGDLPSEMHFLAEVARAADCAILLDVAHWSASNRNLGRPADFGLDVIDRDRVIEVHVAGLRQGASKDAWHDAHALLPDDELTELTVYLATTLPNLRALTFEHDPSAREEEFFAYLERLKGAIQ